MDREENKVIKVFLADDHPLLRAGLKLCINGKEGIELIGEAADGFSAIEKIKQRPPDVSLIDLAMPGLSGIAVIRILRKFFPEMNILVLSTYNDESYIEEAMKAGADGYVLKSVGIDELVKIIKSIHEKKPELSPYMIHLGARYTDIENEKEDDEYPALTLREKEVLQYLAEGKGNKEIANALYISVETVKSHIKNIYRKLDVHNRVEASRVAREKNLIP